MEVQPMLWGKPTAYWETLGLFFMIAGALLATTGIVVSVLSSYLLQRAADVAQSELRFKTVSLELSVSEANARAAEAMARHGEVLRRIGPRSIDIDALLQAVAGKEKPPYPIEIFFPKEDGEASRLAMQIYFTLETVVQWPVRFPTPIPSDLHPYIPSAIMLGGQTEGVSIVENPPPGSDATLGGALRVGLAPSFGQISWGAKAEMPEGAIRIVVAPRPL